jgi:hypothetical protein
MDSSGDVLRREHSSENIRREPSCGSSEDCAKTPYTPAMNRRPL